MISLNYNNILEDKISEEGLSIKDIMRYKDKFVEIHKTLVSKSKREDLMLGWIRLPFEEKYKKQVLQLAKQVKGKYENLLVLGIGGSALGNIALQTALRDKFWNFFNKKQRDGWLKLYVFDNIDPDTAKSLVNHIDIKKTLINVISKAGDTVETLSTFFVFYNLLVKKIGKKNAYKHIIITTGPKKGFLRELVNRKFAFCSFEVPENVGGRYSVLSPVGLVSASLTGINISKLLLGAKNMALRCQINKEIVKEDDMEKNPAFMFALINWLLYQKGKHICVMFSYSDKLYGFTDWFRQLWAESLGKEKDNFGNIINVGPTPVRALGVTDQHSQIQLYCEGPNNKIIVFLSVEKFKSVVKIPKFDSHYLSNHTLNEVFKSEEIGTRCALTKYKRPNMTITLPEINEETVGELIFMLELATGYAGELFNIDAYNQPGVELGKKYTYGLLGREGFEKYKEDISELLI